MKWRFVIADTDGTRLGALVDIKDPSITWRLLDAAEASFTLDCTSAEAIERAQLVTELTSDLLVYADGTLVFRGRIVASTDNIDGTAATVQFTAMDYRALLHREQLALSSTAVASGYSSVDEGAIAWDLISDHQALSNTLSKDVTLGTGSTTGVTRTRPVGYYTAGQNLGEAIDKLALQSNGFDYEISPLLEFNIFHAARGTARDFKIHRTARGGNVTALKRDIDSSNFANDIRFSGATHNAVAAVADIATRPEGRWQRQVGDTTFTTQAGVDAAAQRNLDDSSIIQPGYTATLTRDAGWTPDVFWLGDTCPVALRVGRLDVSRTSRLFEVTVKPDDGGEAVELTFDGPRMDAKTLRVLRGLLSSVENLQRR